MDFMAGGSPPAMVPNGNPIAETMDAMSFGQAAASPVADPFQNMPASSPGGGIPEMTKLREWETKHEEELEELSRKEASVKGQIRETAAGELAKWYQDRTAERTKRVEVNRASEKEMEAGRLAAMKPDANPWERVVDLIDTNSRTADEATDTSRMKSLLIQLKSNPVVTSVA